MNDGIELTVRAVMTTVTFCITAATLWLIVANADWTSFAWVFMLMMSMTLFIVSTGLIFITGLDLLYYTKWKRAIRRLLREVQAQNLSRPLPRLAALMVAYRQNHLEKMPIGLEKAAMGLARYRAVRVALGMSEYTQIHAYVPEHSYIAMCRRETREIISSALYLRHALERENPLLFAALRGVAKENYPRQGVNEEAVAWVSRNLLK